MITLTDLAVIKSLQQVVIVDWYWRAAGRELTAFSVFSSRWQIALSTDAQYVLGNIVTTVLRAPSGISSVLDTQGTGGRTSAQPDPICAYRRRIPKIIMRISSEPKDPVSAVMSLNCSVLVSADVFCFVVSCFGVAAGCFSLWLSYLLLTGGSPPWVCVCGGGGRIHRELQRICCKMFHNSFLLLFLFSFSEIKQPMYISCWNHCDATWPPQPTDLNKTRIAITQQRLRTLS